MARPAWIWLWMKYLNCETATEAVSLDDFDLRAAAIAESRRNQLEREGINKHFVKILLVEVLQTKFGEIYKFEWTLIEYSRFLQEKRQELRQEIKLFLNYSETVKMGKKEGLPTDLIAVGFDEIAARLDF